MKKVEIRDFEVLEVYVNEADFRLSASSREFYEAHPSGSMGYKLGKVDYKNLGGIAGNINGASIDDFEFIINDNVIKKLEEVSKKTNTITLPDIKEKVFKALTEEVEVVDEAGNVLFVYRIDKELEAPKQRKATHNELREFILATEGYDIDKTKRQKNDKLSDKDKRLLKIAKELEKENLIIEPSKVEAFKELIREADFANASIIEELFKVINSFSYATGADGTEFYLKKGSKTINLPKNRLNNIGKFIGRGGANIKELQKEYGVKINLI